MIKPSGRLISILLIGLVVALVIGSLTKRDSPVLAWLVVIGIGLIVGIGREWIATNNLPLAKEKGLSRDYFLFAIGSFPYVAAITLLVIFVYYALKLLMGQAIDPSQSKTLGRVVVLSFTVVFFGGSVLFLLKKKRASRKNELNNDRSQR